MLLAFYLVPSNLGYVSEYVSQRERKRRCVPLFKIDFPAHLAPRLSAFFTPTPLVISFITCPASALTVGKIISFNKGAPTLLVYPSKMKHVQGICILDLNQFTKL